MSTCQRNIPNSYEDQRTFEIMADGEETETNIASNGCYSGEYLPTDCKFTLHTFSDRFADQTVHFQVVKMTNSLYLWIGTSSEMNALAVAMCTKWVSSTENGATTEYSAVLVHLIYMYWSSLKNEAYNNAYCCYSMVYM